MKLLHLVAVAFISLLPSASLAAPQSTTGCSVKPGSYLGWNAQMVTNRWVTLTFVPQLGGRLMQVEFNGHPYLFVNPRFRGKYISLQRQRATGLTTAATKYGRCPKEARMRITG